MGQNEKVATPQRLKGERLEPHLPNHANSPFGATCSFMTPSFLTPTGESGPNQRRPKMTTETGTKCRWCDSTNTADYTVLGSKHVALCQKHTCSGCCPILTEDKVKRECLRTMTDKEFRFVQQKLRDLRT